MVKFINVVEKEVIFLFESILVSGNLTTLNVFLCLLSSLFLGFFVALVHKVTSTYSKNFLVTLVVLPTLIAMVILMVNGNLGTSVAVLGAFSLIRFRSIPGNSKEITSIFLTMAIGLAVGMGYLAFAILTTIVLLFIFFLLAKTSFGTSKKKIQELVIEVPENLEYDHVFEEILKKYAQKYQLIKVKTSNMGSTFELSYQLERKEEKTKDFLDELRCRNGNLKIVLKERMMEGEL